MPKPEEEEEQQHLSTLDDLEATQEEISSYQGLLKDIPEIYERKFKERLQPILERRQELIQEREHLIQQIQRSLPASQESSTLLMQAPAPHSSAPEIEDLPKRQTHRRALWALAIASIGLLTGLLLSKKDPSPSPSFSATPSSRAPSPDSPPEDSVRTNRSSLRSRVIDQAVAEWTFFGKPFLQDGTLIRRGKSEGEDGQWQRISTYWQQGVLNDSIRRREDVTSADNPWSAAFLSYIMKKAGAGSHFPYAPIHATLIKKAIENGLRPSRDASFVGHRVSDYIPRPGDFLCTTRLWANDEVTYDNARDYEFFPARCELVIESSDHHIDVIGGDRMGSVVRERIKTVNGKIPAEVEKNWLVIVETNLD